MPFWIAGAALLGSVISADSASSAADAQVGASEKATQLQKDIYDQTVARNAPFVSGGLTAFNALMDRLGISGNKGAEGYGSFGRTPTGEDVMNEPGYQFGQQQGQNALDRQMNARGFTGSGAAIKAGARYNTDYASTKYGEAFNRIQGAQQQQYNQINGLARMGQASANNTASAGENFGAAAGANMIGAGNAQAANQLAQGNIWQNAINQGVSLYRNQPGQGQGQFPAWASPGQSGQWSPDTWQFLAGGP